MTAVQIYVLFHINLNHFNKLTSLPMGGFIVQLVEHRTGIAEVTGSNPVEALIFFRLLLSSCLNWKIHCDDHSSLSSMTAVQIYELFHINLHNISIYCSCHSNIKFIFSRHRVISSIYYMEESVLLGTKPLVDSIRHFIRDPSGVFSVCHLCECRIVK